MQGQRGACWARAKSRSIRDLSRLALFMPCQLLLRCLPYPPSAAAFFRHYVTRFIPMECSIWAAHTDPYLFCGSESAVPAGSDAAAAAPPPAPALCPIVRFASHCQERASSHLALPCHRFCAVPSRGLEDRPLRTRCPNVRLFALAAVPSKASTTQPSTHPSSGPCLQARHRADCQRELHQPAGHGGAGLLPDQQVLRGTAGERYCLTNMHSEGQPKRPPGHLRTPAAPPTALAVENVARRAQAWAAPACVDIPACMDAEPTLTPTHTHLTLCLPGRAVLWRQ